MNDDNRQMLTLFAELLEAGTPAAQAAYLDRACGGDPALRARLEALLRAHQDAGPFLGGAASTPESMRTVDAPAGSDGPGTVVGPYKLLQQIGEGGMGTVFMAEQSQPVRRMVALKIIKPGMDSQQVIARFEAERQALALMDHPNIATVLDAGTTETGRPYFVMELVKGVPITKYCDEHRLTPKQRLELFLPVCQAVQHAHQKGIIHRDLKPSNVLIALYDDKPVPKVIDFGIAKATGQKLTDRTLFTEFGQVVGTLEYMSPEQAGLNQLDIDTRSDVYSLGVLLYELLTGTTPLEKKRLCDGALLEVLRMIREEEPPKPSARLSTTDEMPSVAANRGLEPKKLSGLMRGELDWIVMKALEKDRNRRYETANGFAVDLQRYLADEPVQACPPSATYRLRKFVRRHKAGLFATAAVLLVTLLASSSVGWVLWDRAAQQAARSAAMERAVSVALVKAAQLGEQALKMPSATSAEAAAVLVVWRQADDALAQAEAALSTGAAGDDLRQRVTAVREQLERGRRQTERASERALRKEKLFRSLDEARMARSVAVNGHFDYVGAAGKYAAAFAEYGLAVSPNRTAELARRLGAEEADVRDALLVALDDWASFGRAMQSKWSAKDLLALAEAVDTDPWRKCYRAAVVAGNGATLRDLSAKARRSSLAPSGLVLLARTLILGGARDEGLALLRWGRNRHPTDFWLHFELGACLGMKDGTPLEVEEEIGCLRAVLALRPTTSAALYNLGLALEAKNQLDEAIAAYRLAIKFDPKFAVAYDNLGYTLQAKNELDEAIAAHRQAIKIDPKHANAHNNLGNALMAKNELDQAIAAYRLAIKFDPRFALAHTNLGNALTAKNQLDEAIAAHRQAIKIDPKNAPAHTNLGNALKAKNQLNEAIAAYRLALEIDPKYAKAHSNLGGALYSKNQFDEAIAAIRQAIKIDPKSATAHDNLGVALVAKNRLDEASAAFRQAIKIDPKHANAHTNLGGALYYKNELDEAMAAFRQAIRLNPKHANAHNGLAVAMRQKGNLAGAVAEFKEALRLDPKHAKALANLPGAERMRELLSRLPDVVASRSKPKTPSEACEFALLCAQPFQKKYTVAVRLFEGALAAEPKLAGDLAAGHRYNAACCAAMAAGGSGDDGAKLDAVKRARLRKQALAWLRAELALWGKRLADGKLADRQVIQAKLRHWLRDADLADVRDPEALSKLSAEEQKTWRQLWADVAEHLKK